MLKSNIWHVGCWLSILVCIFLSGSVWNLRWTRWKGSRACHLNFAHGYMALQHVFAAAGESGWLNRNCKFHSSWLLGTWLEAENRLAGCAFSASIGAVLDWKQTQAPWTGLRPWNDWRLRVPSVELWIMKTWIVDAGWTFWVTYKCHRKGLALRRDYLKLSCWPAFYLWSEANCILTYVPWEKLRLREGT